MDGHLDTRNDSKDPASAICPALAVGNIQRLTGGGTTMLEIPGILDRRVPRRHFLNMSGYSAAASLLNQSVLGRPAESSVNPIRSCNVLGSAMYALMRFWRPTMEGSRLPLSWD